MISLVGITLCAGVRIAAVNNNPTACKVTMALCKKINKNK